MESHRLLLYISATTCLVFLIGRLLFTWFVLPELAYRKLKKNGFSGPKPSFPLGNLGSMKMRKKDSCPSLGLSHAIHSTALPYFSWWQKLHGKIFIYWLGTEPFLYIANPEFLKRMSSAIKGKDWGKPRVFKNDREPMFGDGLVMVEGEDWVRHRHVITPAFCPANLKAMSSLMVESATSMLDRWTSLIDSGQREIDVEKEIISTAGEIIAKTSFGISYENGKDVLEKLRAMQITLFKSNRYVGVPLGKFMNPKQTLKAKRLGKEIDGLLLAIITSRVKLNRTKPQHDLLGLLLGDNNIDGDLRKQALSMKELVDECKTFFFGGHETTALALTWTLLLLAQHPTWQHQLREEIKLVLGDQDMDTAKIAGLKKMGWVMNEALRLYPPAPNVQRQARHDIQVDNHLIPKGTNIWIDVVSMHHDQDLWGKDVNEFKPERFKDDVYGGCNHKMGFLPFGFGGRMCVGRNLTNLEYKIVLTLILSRFSIALSPNYCHSPSYMLSLRPSQGLPLVLQPL